MNDSDAPNNKRDENQGAGQNDGDAQKDGGHVALLTTDTFAKTLEDAGDTPVMVDFFAEWCGPCKLAAPVIDELAQEYKGKAEIYKVDVDDQQELAQEHGVMSIPTVKIFKNGEVVKQQVGFPGKAGYEQMLNAALEG